jgi:RNA polymerase sigma-70 factor (ECF subfamily)
MASVNSSDILLVERIRLQDEDAWRELIARFEGRLLGFVEGRIGNRAASEDVVQETFLGFLTSLPNYDRRRPLEGYLFSIAAHKLTDYLRREGRRPRLPLAGPGSKGEDRELAAPGRAVSSIARSGERQALEEHALHTALTEEIDRLQDRDDWDKITCLELLFVRGWTYQTVASKLAMTEQAVASFKFEFIAKLRTSVRKQNLSADVFPELCETESR